MNTKLGLFCLSVLVGASTAFAVNGSGYYNLTSLKVGMGMSSRTVVVLSQDVYPCTSEEWILQYNGVGYHSNAGSVGYYSGGGYGGWGFPVFNAVGSCLAAAADTPENLYNMLDTSWVKGQKGLPLELGSDIDLGEFSSETPVGTCDVNHMPLPMMDSSSFSGNNFTIRNLCYASSEAMTGPVGFFSSVSDDLIEKVKIDGVRIYISGESQDGADYYPVGAIAGVLKSATLDSIQIANDSIQAPFAGGLVGYLQNATVQNISGNDDIDISNIVSITEGYAGSAVMQSVSNHQVFLGGLVGVAYRSENEDPTFVNDSLKVRVQDRATGNRSALGGIAGVFSTTGEQVVNLHVYTKHKTEESLPSVISGGSAMGGLFGVMTVYMENNSPKPGNFTLSNSSFEGQITDAQSPDLVALGGLIGLDSTIAMMSVKITDSRANVMIKDSMKTAGNFHYYAGGILGYGGLCTGSNGSETDFLSLTGLNTTGSIDVAASGAAVEGLRSQTYLGGIAGAACIAQKDSMGLANDTSSVTITSRMKTAMDGTLLYNGTPSFDSVFVGGLVGFVNVGNAATKLLSGLSYTGSISVEDSLNSAFIGGIMGSFTQQEGGKSLHFKNVSIKSDSLIDYKAVDAVAPAGTSTQQVAKVGGLCGYCNEVLDIERVAIEGGLYVAGAFAGDSIQVGGLLGSSYASNNTLNLKNSYTIGDIIVSATAASVKSGYLLGSVTLNQGFDIKSCYHFGENDLDVNPFGILSNGADLTTGWKANDDIYFVLRNGNKKEYTKVHYNGTELVDSMQKSSFAGLLNKAYGDESENYVWTFVADKNHNLPYLAEPNENKIVPEASTFVVTFVGMKGETIVQRNVKEKESAIAPGADSIPKYEGYTFSGWDKSFENVANDLTIKAVYSINSYTVKFVDYDQNPIGDDQVVEYLQSAVPPEVSVRTGYTFVGWSDSSYSEVKEDLTVTAVYKANEYTIFFVNYDNSILHSYQAEYGSLVNLPVNVSRPATKEYTYEFKGWTPEVVPVSSETTYKAVYDSIKVKYPVVFLDLDENLIGDTLWVEYGSAAVAPEAPVREGYTFTGWDRKFENVTTSIEIMAQYEKIPESSSEMVSSSSAEPESSSSSEESSSSQGEVKIVNPLLEQSGNAVRLTFSTENANEDMEALVLVIGERDTVVVDTIKNVVDGGIWEMTPAPMGTFDVKVIIGDMNYTASYDSSFEVVSEIVVEPKSWQMVSLAALDETSLEAKSANSFYWWDEQNPIGDYWQYRSYIGGEVEATRGFWYGSSDGSPLVLRETSGYKDSEIVWELDSLYSGWNLVANPYGWYVDLSKGSTDDGSEVVFWKWNATAGHYEFMPTVLGPYEAIWAKVGKATTWRVSAAPTFNIKEVDTPKERALHKDRVSGAWSLVAILADENGKTDSWNVIGAGTEETLDEPPAGMGERVSLTIRNSEKGAKLAKSIKALAEDYRWTLELSANSARDGKLSFEGIAELKKLGLKLFLVDDGKVTELAEGKSVDVALSKRAKQVEVRVSASAVVAASTKLGALRSVLSGDQMQVQFDVPEALAGAKASYAVAGVDGKVVASGRFTAASGSNYVTADMPKSGIYFVKVRVGSQELSGKVLKK